MTDGHPSGSVTRLRELVEQWEEQVAELKVLLRREYSDAVLEATRRSELETLEMVVGELRPELAAALAPAVVPSVDLEALAKGVRMLGLLPNEHAQAATYNEALTTAANYIRSFIGREEYLPKSAAPPVVASEIVRQHRRHVELSPGVGSDAQTYALAVCDDILSDLDATPRPQGESE